MIDESDSEGALMTRRKAQAGDVQLSLTGFAEPAKPVKPRMQDRLFLGIFLDHAALASIENVAYRVPREHGVHGKPLLGSRYHVTLHHLGDYPELQPECVDAALSAIDRITTSPFEITLDRVASFRGKPGSHPCVLRCPDPHAGVDALWHESRVHLAAAGFAPWLQRNFTPHLTLLYGDRMLPAPIPVEPITWTVREVVLVHSLLGKTEHRVLGRKTL